VTNRPRITVGTWTVSPALNLLERAERSIKLEPRAMDVLVYLADRAGDVVSVEELLGAVWKGVVVSDGSVYLAIKQLRHALDEPGGNASYIETIPKRGYRLTAPVNRIVPESAAKPTIAADGAPLGDSIASAGSPLGTRLIFSSAGTAWITAGVLATMLAIALVPATRGLRQVSPQALSILDLDVPGYVAGGLAVSPNGRAVAYIAEPDGEARIWVRSVADGTARPLAGTENVGTGNAASLFWSQDSRSLVFMTKDGTLKSVAVDGGPVRALAEASVLSWGSGTWSRDGVVLHTMQAETVRSSSDSRMSEAIGFPIGVVSATTRGTLTPLTRPDLEKGETGHFVPRFLPDDDHFVYIAGGPNRSMATIYLGSRSAPTRTELAFIEDRVQVNRRWGLAYADGYLLYTRGTALVAHRLDVDAGVLVGEPQTLTQEVDDFAVSQTGMLIYSERAPSPVMSLGQERRLTWFDRSGTRVDEIPRRGAFSGVALSPDDERVIVATVSGTPGKSDLSIIDVERGASLPITLDDAAESPAVWSADGRIAFSSGRGSIPFTPSAIYAQASSAAGPQQLMWAGVAGEYVVPSDWSAGVILFSRAAKIGGKQSDIWALPTEGDGPAIALVTTPGRNRSAALSGDGRRMLYVTDESGSDEVIVQPYPAVDGKWPISTNGGSSPRWRSDGREIFYVTPDGILTAVEVRESDGDAFELGQSRELFKIPIGADGEADYDVAGSCPTVWCTSRESWFGWTRAQLTTADNRAV
jgi:DNA-binding winged helix-turn-helix (wHTH) protein/Tol biopolymer transport system component